MMNKIEPTYNRIMLFLMTWLNRPSKPKTKRKLSIKQVLLIMFLGGCAALLYAAYLIVFAPGLYKEAYVYGTAELKQEVHSDIYETRISSYSDSDVSLEEGYYIVTGTYNNGDTYLRDFRVKLHYDAFDERWTVVDMDTR